MACVTVKQPHPLGWTAETLLLPACTICQQPVIVVYFCGGCERLTCGECRCPDCSQGEL
jgi:hypothetical protein